MNLNPLKKDDNTDALVKALEDANATDTTAGAVPTSDSAVDQTAQPTTLPDLNDPAITTPVVDPAAPTENAELANLIAEDPALSTGINQSGVTPAANPAEGLNFDGNDLPTGLSSDAGAHVDEPASDDSELDGVKKSALEQLRPLIEKIELEPADKFDKYLMMLRASDDPSLIKPAFEASQGIVGEKEKAQALLDIINEINYITASKQQG